MVRSTNASLSRENSDGKTYTIIEYRREHEGFTALLGSTLGSIVARMLHDKREEIGGRTIERVVMMGTDFFNDQTERDFSIGLKCFFFVLSDKKDI